MLYRLYKACKNYGFDLHFMSLIGCYAPYGRFATFARVCYANAVAHWLILRPLSDNNNYECNPCFICLIGYSMLHIEAKNMYCPHGYFAKFLFCLFSILLTKSPISSELSFSESDPDDLFFLFFLLPDVTPSADPCEKNLGYAYA